MSIFHPSGAYLAIFQRYKTIGDLFHAQRTVRRGRQNEDRVDLTSPKTAVEEFPTARGQRPDPYLATIRRCFNNLVRAIKKAVVKIPQLIGANDVTNPIKVEDSALVLKCKQMSRGSSFAYHSVLSDQAAKYGIETAPAFHTWENDIAHGMTEREWHNSLKGVARVGMRDFAEGIASMGGSEV